MPGENYPGGVSRTQREDVAGIRQMHSRIRERVVPPGAAGWSTNPGVPRSDRTPRRAEPPPPPPPQSFYGYAEPRPPADYHAQPAYGRMPIPPAPPQNTPPEGGYRQQGQSYGPNHHNRGRERASGPGGFLSNLFGQGSGRRARASPRNQNENFPGNQPPAQEDIPGQPQSRPEPPPDTAERSGTTLIQDILNGIGLDDDRILILGLILILINDKADTTLIFALLYLLL